MSQPLTDRELLREFAQRRSDRAFEAIVQRHVNLVFGAAWRLLHDSAAAQEVTQEVFVALARKAMWLGGEVSLSGWLHRTAVLKAQQYWRSEARRRRREQTAVELQTTMKDDDSALKSLAGALDEGLMSLPAADRQAVLLRYFEDQSHREIGRQLGIGEDAARKRVNRGLDQLGSFLRRKGCSAPGSAALAAALQASSQSAPPGLARLAAQAAVSTAGSAPFTGAALALFQFMSLTKTQTAIVCLALAAGPAAWQTSSLVSERRENTALSERLTFIQNEISALEDDQADLERRFKAAGRSLDYVRSVAAQREAVAKLLPREDDPRLYRWSEDSEYARLPKSLYKAVRLYDPEMATFTHDRTGERFSAILDRRGMISPVELSTLGLDEQGIREVQEAFARFTRDFKALEIAHSTLIKTLPDGESSGDYPALKIEAFPKEGGALRDRLRASLEAVLGSERTEMLWSKCGSDFSDDFHQFGAKSRLRALLRWEGGLSAAIEELDEGRRGRVFRFDDLPELFKPIVAGWNTNQANP